MYGSYGGIVIVNYFKKERLIVLNHKYDYCNLCYKNQEVGYDLLI